ncbi:MAG TPA: hypothetical protein VGR07_02285, partial [Thermoanaerobaculia bacterium]|nr:hypothetical protein [Thermoanaerobaculia bacterium]
ACTACTGVRDVDFGKHVSNTPATVANHTQVRCGAGSGPCGKEVHCESYVASEAIWDFANRDLPNPGTGPAWTILDRLWYLSRNTATSAFACTTGTTFTSNGCAAGNWWKTMRVVDDDDGNLANGTPHSAALFAAFNRHGIACTTDAGASTSFNGCTQPATPTLTITPGDNSAALSWTASGTATYDVFRNETGCNAGFTKIVSGGTATSLNDTNVANGLTYFYQVTAFPTGNEACASAPSTCISVTPVAAPCTPPAAATGLTATASGNNVNLAWTAVSGATEYHILRGTASGGPYTPVGTSTTAAFTDTTSLCGTTYFYVVRAANSATCESANSNEASASTAACPVCTNTTLYTNGFETGTGLTDWTKGTFLAGGATTSWRGIQTCTAQTGTKIFRYGGTTCTAAYGNNNFTFAQPQGATGITFGVNAQTSRLVFGHRWGFESGFDGGTLFISINGTNFFQVPASAIISGTTYNGTVAASCPPAGAAGAPIFTGTQSAFVNTTVDLDAACNAAGSTTGCKGKTVRLSFTAISDCSVTSSGWFIDNVTVTDCQ